MKAELSDTGKGCAIKLTSENNDENKILSVLFDALCRKKKNHSYSKGESSMVNRIEIAINIKK